MSRSSGSSAGSIDRIFSTRAASTRARVATRCFASTKRAQAEVMGCPDLYLIGKLAMELPDIPRLRHLGFVSEEDKHAAMAGAAALICPSPYESLSITLLEAMSHGTPVLASSRSDVLVDHCHKSNAGLAYGTPGRVRGVGSALRPRRAPEARARTTTVAATPSPSSHGTASWIAWSGRSTRPRRLELNARRGDVRGRCRWPAVL